MLIFSVVFQIFSGSLVTQFTLKEIVVNFYLAIMLNG